MVWHFAHASSDQILSAVKTASNLFHSNAREIYLSEMNPTVYDARGRLNGIKPYTCGHLACLVTLGSSI